MSSVISAVVSRHLGLPERHTHGPRVDPFIPRIRVNASLKLHRGCVNTVEYSADGQYILSGSDDTVIALWDAGTRTKKIRYPTRHYGNVSLHV